MLITKLVLECYKRLMSSHIQRIEYTPTKAMQLIIGSNGSGKSSLVSELTPLPSHHENFLAGGSKYLECTHRDAHYVLTSTYSGSGTGKHSFIKDGEEYNKGGTFAIQKDLVETHFGITKEIHEILIGVTPFSAMSTAKRRELLTRLSPVDLSYAFTVYNQVKNLHRDQQGVLKHLTKRMVQENQELPDAHERERMEQELRATTERLNTLFQARRTEVQPGFSVTPQNTSQWQQTIRRTRQLLTQHPQLPATLPCRSLAEFNTWLTDLKSQQQVQQSLLEPLLAEHEQLVRDTPTKDESLTEEQLQALDVELQTLKVSCPTVADNPTVFPLVSLPADRDAASQREVLNHVYNEWVNLLHTFPDNREGRFTQEKGRQAEAQLQTLKAEQQQLQNTQSRLAQRLARLKGCETLECPACTHQFTPGVTPGEVDSVDRELEDVFKRLQELAQAILTTEEYLESFRDYMGFIRAFRRLTEHSPSVFKPLWDTCLALRVMTTQPKDYLTQAVQWHQLMLDQIAVYEHQQRIEVLEHKLRYVRAIDQQALSRLDQRRQYVEEQIQHHTAQAQAIQQQLTQAQQWYHQLTQYQRECERTADTLAGMLSGLQQETAYQFQVALQEETHQVQLKAAHQQERLSRMSVQAGVLTDIEQQHEQAQEAYQDYGLLVKALAPTDGLIGRYLMGFMQTVVKFINAVIAEVWTYPLEVLPSRLDRDELDYKFPLLVNGGAVNPPDIALGSTSQVDIVNFAFKLLVMKFLQLEDFPLYLDEFGSTFDEQHRFNLIPFINRLVEVGQVQQIFFISHYSALHGAFNQAEVCVLDPTNVTVPQVYNQHVVLA